MRRYTGSWLLLLLAALALRPTKAAAPADFTAGFESLFLMQQAGWVLINRSEPVGSFTWFQGQEGLFAAQAGPLSSYAAAAANGTAGSGTISNWMLTPVLDLGAGDTITFYTRQDAGLPEFPNRLEVRMSLAGSSIDVGSSATSVGVFTTTLLTLNPDLTTGVYPNAWTAYTITLHGIGLTESGRIAWRYFVTDGGPQGSNSSYIGVDSVSFTKAMRSTRYLPLLLR